MKEIEIDCPFCKKGTGFVVSDDDYKLTCTYCNGHFIAKKLFDEKGELQLEIFVNDNIIYKYLEKIEPP